MKSIQQNLMSMLKEHSAKRYLSAAVGIIAIATVLAVVWSLHINGITLASDDPTCGLQEHEHTAACYDWVMLDGTEEIDVTEGTEAAESVEGTEAVETTETAETAAADTETEAVAAGVSVSAENTEASESASGDTEDSMEAENNDTENGTDGVSASTESVLDDTEEGTESIAVKEEVPTVTKYVSNGTSTATSGTSTDAVSASIGSELTFTLVGTLPSSTILSTYDEYTYIFHDILSSGLTLTSGSIKVYATNDISDLSTLSTSASVIDTSDYSTETDSTNLADGCTLEVSFSDILTANISGDTTLVTTYTYVVVQYTASLNENAVIGYSSTSNNSNTVYLEYSNDPNTSSSSASGGTPTSPDTPTGTTTKEVVNVYTYELDITKANGTDANANGYEALSGAVFVLYDSSNNYATISNGTVTGWVDSTTYDAATDKSAYQVTSDASGKITISGLGVGTYSLKEITAPSGYNLLSSPVTIEISATETTSGVTDLKADVTVESSTSTVTSTDSKTLAMTIVNTIGSSLPTTGGIGTTMFYVVGMILVLGAAVVLVTRRRMAGR